MSADKTSRQVIIARTPVQIATALSEETLKNIVEFVDKKFAYHEKSVSEKTDDNKKTSTLIITLLDVAAELWDAKKKLREIEKSGKDLLAEVNLLDEI
ncbi:hypothetical protein AGMMS49938_09640 [Fibrobacterales bacterium]|nr:hypothetical protein AGMMS49938_09640 [Fibrobacterales bacterium]